MIAEFLDGNAISAFGISCKNIHDRLQPATLKFNIEYQNSNLLHLAAKTNHVSLAEAMLDYQVNVNAFFRGKTPIMRALEHSATEVLKLLLKTPGVDINLQNQALESALWYAIKHGTCLPNPQGGPETQTRSNGAPPSSVGGKNWICAGLAFSGQRSQCQKWPWPLAMELGMPQ